MDYLLSDTDVLNLCQNAPPISFFNRCSPHILSYENLVGLNSIDEALSPDGTCVLLYQEKKYQGHFVALFKRLQTIYFFDSYGGLPDRQQKYLPDEAIERFYSQPTLVKLLVNSPYSIDFSPVQFQSFDKDIATCGRWCVVRLWLRSFASTKFEKFILKNAKRFRLSPDELVYLLTST